MKKITIYLLLFCSLSFLFSDIRDFSVDKEKIKVGEKATLSFILDTKENVKILKQELVVTPPVELLNEVIKKENDGVRVSYTFSIYETGKYTDLTLRIPFLYDSGKVNVFETGKFNMQVDSSLKEDEKTNLDAVKDPSQVTLKKPVDIKKFRFYIEGTLFWILIIIVVTFIILLIYKFVIKKINPKTRANDAGNNEINGFEKFLFSIERINVDTDNRKEIEYKISLLSETLKEFIRWTFKFNATSETTKELLKSMRESEIETALVSDTGTILNELDMIKFAKAQIDINGFKNYAVQIKELGIAINNYSKREPTDNEFNKI